MYYWLEWLDIEYREKGSQWGALMWSRLTYLLKQLCDNIWYWMTNGGLEEQHGNLDTAVFRGKVPQFLFSKMSCIFSKVNVYLSQIAYMVLIRIVLKNSNISVWFWGHEWFLSSMAKEKQNQYFPSFDLYLEYHFLTEILSVVYKTHELLFPNGNFCQFCLFVWFCFC